jgi:predicted alpha/beta superfamily hydrolase
MRINLITNLLISLSFVSSCAARQDALPKDTPAGGITGTVIHYPDFESEFVDARNVDIWLPPDYDEGAARYPVLYMHDGQNLYDPSQSYIGVDWGVDEAMTDLFEGTGRAAIVVGIANTSKRLLEYMPRGMTEGWTAAHRREALGSRSLDDLESDAYLKFLVDELKPWVDATYRTQSGPAHTMVAGSSLGGLISIYALTEYPEVFGVAAGVSTHWLEVGDAAMEYLDKALPSPGANRIYLDYGTETLDSDYEPWHVRVESLVRGKGFGDSDLAVLKFGGHDHSERSWKRRMPSILAWMMAPDLSAPADGARILHDQAYLSSDDRGGRKVGSSGSEDARNYIRAALEEAGVAGVTEQTFTLEGARGTNVYGMVPGTEPGSGVIALTAHYDHLGTRGERIYNGADDNASGTAAILGIARALVQNPLRHTVLVAALDAEESGLRGARALVEDLPVPEAQIILNLNLDMISRSEAGELYATGARHYPALKEILDPIVAGLPVTLLFGHDEPGTGSNDWTHSSDHAAFHQRGIPFLYFGVEDHPGYHNPSDVFEDTTPAFYLEAVATIYKMMSTLDGALEGRVPGQQ